MNIVKFLSSGVARQHRIACDDLSAILFYGFSNLRYYKQNNANINNTFKFWTSILSPIPRRKMKLSINFSAMLNLVRQIKSFLNRNPSLELLDITHAPYTNTYLLTGRISKLDLYSLKSYTCVCMTSWITLVGLPSVRLSVPLKSGSQNN